MRFAHAYNVSLVLALVIGFASAAQSIAEDDAPKNTYGPIPLSLENYPIWTKGIDTPDLSVFSVMLENVFPDARIALKTNYRVDDKGVVIPRYVAMIHIRDEDHPKFWALMKKIKHQHYEYVSQQPRKTVRTIWLDESSKNQSEAQADR